ncbi:MAG: glycerol kinase, partial [Alphaproteobacteria bacterium]|nr:glycerol kinase [Alphaproteobacteria bacterium]
LLGQACFSPGMVKATYGTGCFVLLNTGQRPVASRHRLLTTIAYQLDGQRTYALEGSIFIAGAALQWLRDGLGVIAKAENADEMARQAAPDPGLYMVPAFVGLAAPDWRPDARGAIFGLTRATGPNDLVRAALESVCFQTRDLIEAMVAEDTSSAWSIRLRVDGGMSASDWMLQHLADILDTTIDRPQVREATALGAAWLARRGSDGAIASDDFWRLDRDFSRQMDKADSAARIQGWRRAVAAVISLTAPQP